MSTKFSEQNIPISMEKLFQNSEELKRYLERDSVEFENFGINLAYRTAFGEKVEKFRLIHYDIEKVDEQKQSGYDKLESADVLRDFLFDLQLKTDLAYNLGKVSYRLIDLGGVSQHDLQDLRRVSEVYERMLVLRMSVLADFGLTEADIETLQTLRQAFSEAFTEHNWRKSERKVATIERRRLANELYTEYSSLCKLGRQMWAKTNPAKSSNYVMNFVSTQTEEETDS